MDGYVFISYRHGIDGPYVLQLAEFLAENGISTWHDSKVVTGDRWERVIKDKIEGCSAFAVIMTPDSEQSDWVNREITHAEHMRRPILPLLLKGERFFRLSNFQFENVGRGELPTPRFVEKLRQLVGQLDPGQLIDNRREVVVTVARRNQIHLYHLLESINAMELREPDSAWRAELARAKTFATRIQRNDERLLIVVDDESVRRGGREVAKLNTILFAQADLRAARQIELLHADGDIEIVENVVHDLGLLIGELFENAINFSAPGSGIRVEVRRRPAGVILTIEDHGIGIKREPLTRLNDRLSGPPVLNVEILRQMGLAVVARLAHRHGLTVELKSTFESGSTAEILLPDSVIATTRGRNPRWPEIPAKVVRAGIAALPRDEAKYVLDELSQQQVRVILAGLAAERAQTVLDQGRNAGWPMETDVARRVRPGLPPTDQPDAL